MHVSQKEIARVTGYSQSTISMALAGSSEIAAETRRRILEIATGLGYRPDPHLSALAAYRKTTRPPSFQAALAFVTNYRTRDEWRNAAFIRRIFDGASKRADQLGYRLEPFWLTEKGMTPARLRQILLTRNIRGLMFAPQFRSRAHVSMEMESFAAITFGFTLISPRLDAVGNHNYRTMIALMRKLRALGYRRPGLCLKQDTHERSDHSWLTGFWSEQQRLAPKDRIPWLIEKPFRSGSFASWLKRHRPDCVVAMGVQVHSWLQDLGYEVPTGIGLAYASLDDPESPFSGMYENFEQVGQKASDWLVTLLQRHDYGEPAVPTRLLVEGSWIPGTTVRRVNR